jgi:hypothetical protein
MQVYLAEWNRVTVAVKLLLPVGGLSTDNVAAITNLALSESNPVLLNLEAVSTVGIIVKNLSVNSVYVCPAMPPAVAALQ